MAADEGDWECPHCTLSNSAGSRICEACANPRASGGDGADASPPDVVEEAPPENMWCCAVCTYHNAMFSSRCVICTQGTRPEHLAGDATQVDPATEFTRVFGDGDTSDAALEAKLQELCTYLLAFEERGEVFGRRNDRKIMECLAKLLSAYVEAPAEAHPRLGKEKKGAAATTEPAAGAERAAVPPNVQAVPPRLHAGGASGSTPVRRGRSARGGAAGPSVPPSVSPAEGTASRAAPAPPPPAAVPPPPAPAPPRRRGVNAMELVCRALWTYEEVTELHSEEGYGPMLAEAPMRALLAVLEPTIGAGAAAAPAREKPKGKDKGKGKAKAKATKELPEAEVPFELPPPQTLDPDRRLAAEESVKLIMLLGQVRRGGATASRRDLLIRRVFPGTGGLEARRIVIRLGGLAVLGEYTRACYKDGRIANALDALTLMQGLCQVSREQPGDAFVPALVSLLKDDAAVPLHHECLRCIASVYAACAEREGAVLALVHGNLPALLAKTLGRGVATETPAGRSSPAERSLRASESQGDVAGAASTSAAASLPVMDIASRLVLWFFSPNTPRVAHLCFREGMLDLLSDADVLIRACAADGSGGTTAAVTLLLQATEKALAHLYAPDAPAVIDGGKKKDASGAGESGAGRSGAAAALEASHHGLQIGDRVRDVHHDCVGEIISTMSRGRCLVAWDERMHDSDEDEDERMHDSDEDEDEDMHHDDDDDIDELGGGHGDVPSEYLELVEADPSRGLVGHAAARAAGSTAAPRGPGDVLGGVRVGGPEGAGGGPFAAALPGSREFWIGAGVSGSSAAATSGDPVRAAKEAKAVESARLVPLARRREMAKVFTARLLPALLAAQRAAAHEPTKRLILRLVLSLLSHVGDSERMPKDDFASLLSLLGTTLSDAQSSGLLMLALQVMDSLIKRDAGNARELRRHGLLRRVEQLAAKGAGGGKKDRTSPRKRTSSSLNAALQAVSGTPVPPGGISGAAREQEQVYAMARQTLDNADASLKTKGVGSKSEISAEKFASMAAAIAGGDASAVKRLASLLVSAEGVTVYEMEEARLATALVHYLVGDGDPQTESSTLATRRDAFRIAFLEPATPPRTSRTLNDESKDAGSNDRTAFAALLRLLHSTLELNEQLPLFRNLALGHRPIADASRPGGERGGDAAAKLASGLNMLAAPLRLTLRRSPLAARGVTDLAGAPLHAGPLTPSAAIEHHVLRRVVILDAGYRRWCDALVGGKIWLWIPGTVNREDVDAVEDGEEPPYTHASPTRHRRRRGGSNTAVSPAEAEKAGRWAAADVERYDPTTGRHALVVDGGVGFKPEAGAPPALQHVALVERKYRVIHRPEPKPPPPPEKPRLGKDKKKRSKPDAKTDSRTDKDESARKRRRKAKEPVKATKPDDVTPDTFRVILLQPEADWDVDVFVENHVDQLWNILEEEAAKFAPAATPPAVEATPTATPAGAAAAAAAPAETPEDAAAREITAAVASRLDRALGLSPTQIRIRHRRVNADGEVDDEEVDTDDEGILLHTEDVGHRASLGWESYAHFEEEVMDALEHDMSVPIVKKGSRGVCDAVAAAVSKQFADLTPAVRLNPRPNGAGAGGTGGRATQTCRPPLGVRVVVEPDAAEEARRRQRIASQGLPAPPPEARGGGGGERPNPDDTWLAGTVVRHRAADAVDVELDTDGSLVENIRLEDLRTGDEEEDRLAKSLLPVPRAAAATAAATGGATGGAASTFRVGENGEIQLDVHLGSSREQVHSAVGEMLQRGVSRDQILEALMRASGVPAGPGGSIHLRRFPGADSNVGIFSVTSSRSPMPPGVGGGLARSWSGLDISEAGRDGTRIMRADISLDQLRKRGDEEAIARAPSQPPSRPASRGPPGGRPPSRPPSRLGGPSSVTPEKVPSAPPPPPPRRCEKPPTVRVRFALATPDDSGATAASLFAPKPPHTAAGGLNPRTPTLSALPFPGSTSDIVSNRARAAAASPATKLRAAPGSATLFHTLRSLAAAASTAAAATGGDGEDVFGGVAGTGAPVPGSTDHDRWFARAVIHYDACVTGLPAGMESTIDEISTSTPPTPPPLPLPQPAPAARPEPELWHIQELRDRLLGGTAPKLTKTAVLSRLKAVCGAGALATRDLQGAPAAAAKRVSSSKLADIYAELFEEHTRDPTPMDEDDEEEKEDVPSVPEPSPAKGGGSAATDEWSLYWELLRRGGGGDGGGPPEPAPIRALAPNAAAGDGDEDSSAVSVSVVSWNEREGGRDPSAAAASVALLSALHRRFGPVGGASAWENSRVAHKLQAQLDDAVAVASGALPAWTHTLLRGAWFLFPLEARLRHFHSTAFGTSRSVTWVQEQAGAGGGVGGGDGDPAGRPRGGARRLGTLKRERVTVRRDHVLADADVLMRHHARHKSVLEVLFTAEEGFGGAVTKEFYNKVADALQLRSENNAAMMWVPDEDGDEGPEHLWQTKGLFPHPLPPSSPESELARRRFRFIGRLVGKALLDGHILPLPINPTFMRVAVLNETLTEEDLPQVYDDRCAGGAVVRWLQNVVRDVKREKECEQRLFSGSVGPQGGDCADDKAVQGGPHGGVGASPHDASLEASDAAAIDTNLERLSYLSYACPVTRVPLTEHLRAGDDEVHVGNVEQYLADVTRYLFVDGIAAQVDGFREGLCEIFPVDSLKAFGAEEITELVCGKDAIEWTREELRRSVLPGFQYTAESPPYLWLLDVLVEAPDEERRGFLEFVAVCPRLPPGGLAALPRGPIRVNRMDPVDKLPEGRTCSQELRLPAYGSKEELARKLRLALQWRNHLGIQ